MDHVPTWDVIGPFIEPLYDHVNLVWFFLGVLVVLWTTGTLKKMRHWYEMKKIELVYGKPKYDGKKSGDTLTV